jgi:hypothetical protein
MNRSRSIAPWATVLALLCFLPLSGQAQGLPQTEIWLLPLESNEPAGQPIRLTKTPGYHNQPHFSDDSKQLFFTAEAEGSQTDIWVHDLQSGRQDAISTSIFSDFSPTPIPGQHAISVVRVEGDGRQRLWRVDLGTGEVSLLLEHIEPVGYHAWMDENRVALFILGDTFDLQVAQLGQEEPITASRNIGRTLRVNRKTGELLFVNKNVEPWEIAGLDPVSLDTRSIMPLFPNIEDFEWSRQGRIWSGNGSKLYVSDPGLENWTLAADLSEFGIAQITRIGASPDGRWLAIVSSP